MSKMLFIYLDEELKQELKEYCIINKISLKELTTKLIKNYLKKMGGIHVRAEIKNGRK